MAQEEQRAYSAAYYAVHKEEIKKHYAEHREEICAKARAYRAAHREELKEREAERYQRRRKQVLAQAKEYYATHACAHCNFSKGSKMPDEVGVLL